MIEIKTAVKKAGLYLSDMYFGENIQKPLLEEVEYKQKENQWAVTFSFYIEKKEPDDDEGDALKQLSRSLGTSKYRREYKIFNIDANNGSLVSMKIRKCNE